MSRVIFFLFGLQAFTEGTNIGTEFTGNFADTSHSEEQDDDAKHNKQFRYACVYHLETSLGWRQAYISQHLMALRKANILQDRREGRYIFYRMKDPSLLDLLLSPPA